MGWRHNNDPNHIDATPLITGDGTKFVDPFFHSKAKPKIFDFTITEFSTHTGKPVQVLYRLRTDTEDDATAVEWVNTSGTAMIAIRPRPGRPPPGSRTRRPDPDHLHPVPPNTQRLLLRGTSQPVPAW